MTAAGSGAGWRAARVARGDTAVGFELEDTDLRLDGWTLRCIAEKEYQARIDGEGVRLDLSFVPTQAILLLVGYHRPIKL